jgi:hypothetical protein
MTTMSLQPGDCESVFCDWMNPPMGPQNLWFRADDDGSRTSVMSECINGNDLLYLPGYSCFIPG